MLAPVLNGIAYIQAQAYIYSSIYSTWLSPQLFNNIFSNKLRFSQPKYDHNEGSDHETNVYPYPSTARQIFIKLYS